MIVVYAFSGCHAHIPGKILAFVFAEFKLPSGSEGLDESAKDSAQFYRSDGGQWGRGREILGSLEL